jgi:hypothetical protein
MLSRSASLIPQEWPIKRFYNTLFWLTFVCTIFWIARMAMLNEVPPDQGDGIVHYFIAKSSWQQPHLFLDHWGKPLFTLLSSPFAQGGFTSYIGFNVLVFALTIFIGRKLIQRLTGESSLVESLFPVLLLSTPDFVYTLVGGLTEPLFGLLVLVLLWFYLTKKWFWFALLAGAMPFARSEGQLVVLLAAMPLVAYRQWKVLPVLGLIGLLYALIGQFVLGDFLWYIHDNPYTGAAQIYHHGAWNHYLLNWKNHMGLAGGMLCFALFFTWFMRDNQRLKGVHILALTIWLGIMLVHSYLWAHGEKGALGLTRLALHGWPAALVAGLALFHTGFSDGLRQFTRNCVLVILTVISLWSLTKTPYPNEIGPFEKSLSDAAEWVEDNRSRQASVYYYHPALALWAGQSIADTSESWHQLTYHHIKKRASEWQSGDFLVVDSHFQKMEMAIPDSLPSGWKKIRRFASFSSAVNHLGLNYYVDVYQYQPESDIACNEEVVFPIKLNEEIWSNANPHGLSHEFRYDSTDGEAYLLITWSLVPDLPDSDSAYFVVQTTTKWEYLSYPITSSGKLYIPLSSTDSGYKFSIDVPQDTNHRFSDLSLVVVKVERNKLR